LLTATVYCCQDFDEFVTKLTSLAEYYRRSYGDTVQIDLDAEIKYYKEVRTCTTTMLIKEKSSYSVASDRADYALTTPYRTALGNVTIVIWLLFCMDILGIMYSMLYNACSSGHCCCSVRSVRDAKYVVIVNRKTTGKVVG
jgi:hypothetical protein